VRKGGEGLGRAREGSREVGKWGPFGVALTSARRSSQIRSSAVPLRLILGLVGLLAKAMRQ